MLETTLTVSQVNEYAKNRLSMDPLLRRVSVKGEIRQFKIQAGSGHAYFTIKDENSALDCTMWRSALAAVRFVPNVGTKVVVTGQVTVYAPTGKYQLVAESMKQEGTGDLFLRFEEMKNRLMLEGLFDTAAKKPIPRKVKTIGVATSISGAAVRDIIKVARARNPRIDICISPCAVQGRGAEDEIAEAVRRLDEDPRVEVILVGRGGGSAEDLWCFNEEKVARAIYACKTPVISCVGHETDTTIADFTADLRAATPSHAAELAVADVARLNQLLEGLQNRLTRRMLNAQSLRWLRLNAMIKSAAFEQPRKTLIVPRRERIDRLKNNLITCVKTKQTLLRTGLEGKMRLLESLNPDNIKKRGYACVVKNGHLVTSAAELAAGDEVRLELSGGHAEAKILGKGS